MLQTVEQLNLPARRTGRSLQRTLIAALFSIFVVGALMTGAYFYIDTHNTRERLQEQTLRLQAQALVEPFEAASDPRQAVIPPDWNRVYASPAGAFFFTLYDKQGRPLLSSPSLQGRSPLPLTDAPRPGVRFGPISLLGPNGDPVLTARVQRNDMLLVVGRSVRDEDALAESVAEESVEPTVVLIPFALIAALIISLILARILKPLRRASREAEMIGPATLSTRIDTHELPTELRPLVDAFNSALDRLAEAYQVERRLTENAAHELRTPLTVLGVRLQRAQLGEVPIEWDAVQRDISRMGRLVSQLLSLARKEAKAARGPDEHPVSLSRATRAAAASLLPLAEARNRDLRVESVGEVMVPRGSSDDLNDMVRNLIENAIYHGAGTVLVTIDHIVEEGRLCARLEVADEGQGIDPELRELLFERFQKGTGSTEGSGLGLAIVQQVVRSLGGAVGIKADPPTRFEVLLPV